MTWKELLAKLKETFNRTILECKLVKINMAGRRGFRPLIELY